MLYTALATLLLPSVILAAPTTLGPRAGDELCGPTSYTLSDFVLATSESYAYVNFNFKSAFADGSSVQDTVSNGANCQVDGTAIPNSNECSTEGRKLLFDLRGPQEQAYYQITHTWTCNGSTWMSGTPVQVEPLTCNNNAATRICSGGPLTITPQNVRKICNSPRC